MKPIKYLIFLFAGTFVISAVLSTQNSEHVWLDWDNYLMKISASIPLGHNVRLSERHQVREKAREKILSLVSISLENLYIDADHQLKDYLDSNATFAHKYSIFLETLEMGSLFIRKNKIKADLAIPLRNKNGLLYFLPMPWQIESYNSLKEPEFTGEAYLNSTVISEFPHNKAPVKYSGLIIDARDLSLHVALAPRIYTQDGRLIFGPEFLKSDIAINRGIVAYVTELNAKLLRVRAGDTPLMTSALSSFGKNKTDLVISLEDGSKLFDDKDTVINLLKCRVVILYNPEK